MPNPIEAQIKERIQSFIIELDILVRRNTLDALKSVLAGSSAPAPRRSAGPGRPKGSGRGGNVDEAAAKIVAHVQANDGQGIGAIASSTGVALKQAKKAAIRLLASGALKKSGQKRGTRYHVGSGRAAPAKAKGRKRGKRKA